MSEVPPPPPPFMNPGGKLKVKKRVNVNTGGDSLQTALSGIQRSSHATTKGAHYFADKSPSGFVGLSNQGATCYLNSFLQSLYLSPEFFQLLFSWKLPKDITEEKKEQSIPYQLQMLFANLTLSDKKSVDTKALTTTFGWSEDSVSFSQHDIQELRLVLFDALQKCFTAGGTVQLTANNGRNIGIPELFEGQEESYIQCLECEYRSSRVNTFRDILLMVREVGGLEESLQLLLQPEEMMGENKYHCGGCGKLTNALKGTNFLQIPPVLTFQFLRFDFDYNTFARIKINSRFTFPLTLNMSKYANNVKENEGEYDLYAVLIHSGGANGGHYFAYIKDPSSHLWFCFNDQNIKQVSQEQVFTSFGGSIGEADRGKVAGNAYMVIYRNPLYLRDHFPISLSREELIYSELKEEIKKQNDLYRKEKEEYEFRKSLYHLQLLCPAIPTSNNKLPMISISKHETLQEATIQVHKELASDLPLDCIRLRGYDKIADKPTTAFTGKSQSSLEDLTFYSGQIIFVETKGPEESFSEIESDTKINISVILWNPDNSTFENEPLLFPIYPNSTLHSLKSLISAHIQIPVEEIRLFHLNIETMNVMEFTDDASPVSTSMTLYCEKCIPSAPSQVVAKFESEKNMIDIRFNLPGQRIADQNISFDKRKALSELKQAISQVIHIPPEQFLLCNNILAKKQYKDLSSSIENSKIFDGGVIFVCPGTPLEVGEFQIKVYLLMEDYYVIGNSNNASLFLKDLTVHEDMISSRLTDMLFTSEEVIEDSKFVNALETLKEAKESSSKCLRWRQKKGFKAGQVLLSSKSLKESLSEDLQDGFEFYVEILNSPTDPLVHSDFTVFNIIQWHSSSWTVSEKMLPVVLSQDSCLRDVKEYIEKHLEIPVDCVQIVKCPPRVNEIASNCPISIAVLNWNTPEHIQIMKSPWYLKHGDTLLFKDARAPEKEDIDPELKSALLADGIEESIYIRTEYD